MRVACASLLVVSIVAPRALGQCFEPETFIGQGPVNPTNTAGSVVALSDDGTWLVVTDPYFDGPLMDDEGTVWIYQRTSSGWTQVAQLEQPSPAVNDLYGRDAAISADGSRLVIGASNVDLSVNNSGGAFVYERTGSTWSLEATLEPADIEAGELFGLSVDMSNDGETILAGAPRDGATDKGAGYVFQRILGQWAEVAKLTSPALTDIEQLGELASLSGDGDWAFLRTRYERIFVFRSGPGGWQEFTDFRSGFQDFAESISSSQDGSRVLVANSAYPVQGSPLGAGLVYERSGGTYLLAQAIESPIANAFGYGWGTQAALNDAGNVAVVAGELMPNPASGAVISGIAAVYVRVGGSFVLQSELFPSGAGQLDVFGRAVDVSADGSVAIVGAPSSDLFGTNQGAVFAYACGSLEYCTAKPNSLGCVPFVTTTGVASTSLPGSFEITASDVLNARNGLFFYGLLGPAALPFQGGTLCVQPPLRRTAIQQSGGSPPPTNDCSGSLTYDMNALIQSGADPGLVAGAHVHGQYWYRDTQHPDGTGSGLSDATTFTIWN